MKYAISVDIGGTNTRVALVDSNFNIIERSAFETYANDPKENIRKIKEEITKFGYDVIGIGLSCPGPLDLKKGIVLTPPNLPGWHGFEIVNEMSNLMNIPVILENDANLACLGEAIIGAGKSYSSVQYFTISTGIGGGFVSEGKIFQGSRGFAQEIANIILQPQGHKLGDLMEGSLESISSGTAITARAKAHGLDVHHAGDVNELSHLGNYHAKTIMGDAKEILANAIAISYGFLDPEVVILGGGVTLNIDNFSTEIENLVKNKVYPVISSQIKILTAELGDDSGLIGGGILVFGSLS